MTDCSVVFVAFEENENLGIRYMAALLSNAGYRIVMIDFRRENSEILNELISINPLVVGFSVIFDNHINGFKKLIEYLREEGVKCHFTAGGHLASLRPDDLFRHIPSLDSLVRFEGENTILELVEHIYSGNEWHHIIGISYKKQETVVHNPLRKLEPDLDRFPYPVRSEPKEYALDKRYTTLLAGRGCVYQCSFCDIRKFYNQVPGPVKRVRNPEKVAEEMEYMHMENGASVFLFQDDDFPVRCRDNPSWVRQFCHSLAQRDLSGRIMWKINCRPDEIVPESFELMKQHGLFRVYLGIDDGTDLGLLSMNKKLRVADHLKGIQVLKTLGIHIDFGFLLFQPQTTFLTLEENLSFLESICEDGYMPITFMKMMPYMETAVENELKSSGRLIGDPGFYDYDFFEESLNHFHTFIMNCFNPWFNNHNGLSNLSKWASNYLAVFSFFNRNHPGMQRISVELRERVAASNRFLVTTVKELSGIFKSGRYLLDKDTQLEEYRRTIEEKHASALIDIQGILEKIELYSLTRNFFLF
ncbi:MAG: B12-binding domain-containing radical SAM protein [Bacteroidales bacterium]|nr:B12-binding domain-containing radical SAM protein [Bacteroidales bacterium]